MSEPRGHVRIDDREMLARFVMAPSWVRADGGVRPEAFIPHPHPSLSVDRHGTRPETELWARGRRVADLRKQPLLGRADLGAGQVRDPSAPSIDIVPVPLHDAPEHASIIGWPSEKQGQKMIAQRIAASATFVRLPRDQTI